MTDLERLELIAKMERTIEHCRRVSVGAALIGLAAALIAVASDFLN
jgi:hypothetical protein